MICFKRYYLLLAICFSIFVKHSHAQQFAGAVDTEYFKEYLDISSGLSNNYISKIQKDELGMMWFAAEGGLNRYDGKSFKVFRPNDRYRQLLNENIETIFVDRKGLIWVGTKSGGLSRYDQSLDQFVSFNPVIRPNDKPSLIRITDIEEDHEGNIWVATWGLGLYKINGQSYQLEERFNHGKIVADIEVDDFGNVWTVSNNVICKYDPSEGRLIKLSVPIGTGMELFFNSQLEELLVGSSLGLFSFDISNYQVRELDESIRLGLARINAINVDREGRVWAGSWNQGLFLLNAQRTEMKKYPLNADYSLNTNYEIVLDIFIDSNHLLWIATGYGGVVKLNPKRSISYVANNFNNQVNLPDNNVQAITKDTNSAIWVGTWSGGIGYSFDGLSYQNLPGAEGIKVSSFLQVGDTMLVGTAKGILGYDLQAPEEGPILTALSPRKIKDILLDRENRLWVGTQQNGLFLFDYSKDKTLKNKFVFKSRSQAQGELNSERISKIIEDEKGEIWVGSYNGLYQYNPTDSTFERKDKQDQFPSVIILSLFSTDSDILWLGMPGGIFKVLNEGKDLKILKAFNSSEGLKNDYITAVTADVEGNIWLSNTSGIATIRKKNGGVINLIGGDQLTSAMNINAYHNDGTSIYFGSSNGLYFFDPMQVDLVDHAPKLIFSWLKIDNKEVNVGEEVNNRVILDQSMPYTQEVRITHEESIVAIGFVPNDFQGLENLNYYYRIVGLQDNWIDNGQTSEISLIGLDRGSYELEVKSTRDKVNFSKVSSIGLKVLPPPWLSNWAFAFYLILLIILIVMISRFFVNRTKLEAKLEMAKLNEVKEHELNEAKLRFFTNISHELRTPLTLIISPVTEILNQPKLKTDIKEKLTYVEKNADKLLRLINQLIDFRKADQDELKLQVAEGDFIKFAKEIFLSFRGYAETQGVIYQFETSLESLKLTFDRDKMEIVLCNLLSNAFKFTTTKGLISFKIEEEDGYAIFSVKDTGKGISKDFQDKIFSRFFQVQDSESLTMVGSGIGLSLSQRIIKLHNGEIKVQSSLGKGSNFVVSMPKGYDHFEASSLIENFQNSEKIDGYDKYDLEEGREAEEETVVTKLLIIDDNKDILSYQQSLFQNAGYQVETAENGSEGIKKALEIIPDLIISDVMMPEVDGIELCKTLKNTIETSHIPIILLTARTATVYEVDGLDTGADDYVRKPFDAQAIKSRVASLLENRRKVRSHFMNKVRFEAGAVVKPINREEQFIQELSDSVFKSLNDEDFSIERLADELCMSQSTLYRKIKSLTGLSIAGFIRSIRLKKATEILISEDIKLSAVAYAVGFNDYKYFKKSFTAQYGISPKEYREKAIRES